MFGLGLLELVVIVGVVVVLFGASGAQKLIATARSVSSAKRDLTAKAVLGRLVDDPSETEKPAKRAGSNPPSAGAS